MNSTQLITEAHEHQKGKVCSKCKEHKLLSEFSKRRRSKDGLSYSCKSCAKEYKDNMCPFKKWFLHKRGNAKVNGIEFTIEPEDIPGVRIRETITVESSNRKYYSWEAVEYPKVCPILGLELDWGMNGLNNNSPSLDRNPKFGYVKGKVMLMSQLANKMKSNATTEQLNQFSRYFLFGNNNG